MPWHVIDTMKTRPMARALLSILRMAQKRHPPERSGTMENGDLDVPKSGAYGQSTYQEPANQESGVSGLRLGQITISRGGIPRSIRNFPRIQVGYAATASLLTRNPQTKNL